MPQIPAIRKAMIIIAVSQYKPSYPSLPGTLTSAERMAKWARQNTGGRNYDVLEITDTDGTPVTVDRLRKEISNFLETRIIDRLVIYFAGHGLVRSASDQFWLLTNASQDLREGVDLMAFVDGLKRYSIGASSAVLKKGQLCIIADACRNTHINALGFKGDPILTNAAPALGMEIDFLMATTLGHYAYQPNAVAGAPPYCLFSDTLSEALEGKVPGVIDNLHPLGSVIDNQLLADYLDAEVPTRAALYNEQMTPDTASGLRRNNNYYDILPPAPLAGGPAPSPVPDHGLESFSPMPDPVGGGQRVMPDKTALGFQPATKKATGFGHVIDRADYLMERMDADPQETSSVVCEFDRQVAVPIHALQDRFDVRGEQWRYRAAHENDGTQIFVRQAEGWTLAPLMPHTLTVLQPGVPGDVLFHAVLTEEPDGWDKSLSSMVANTRLQPNRLKDALRLADGFRYGKKLSPNNANVAAYLYQLSGDTANIARTAHYMAGNGFLSCDLALLAASDMRWEQGPQGWSIMADLPDVPADEDETRPEFATNAMPPLDNVPVASLFPSFRQGWRRMSDVPFPSMPPVLRQLSSMAAGYSAVVLPDTAMEILIEHFQYTVTEPPNSNPQ